MFFESANRGTVTLKHRRLLLVLFLFSLAGFLFYSGLTLRSFPPVNFDEVSNAVMAVRYPITKRVTYELMVHVVDPRFALLTAAGQEGLRALYTTLLSWASRACDSYQGLRSFSFGLWLLVAVLFARRIARDLGSGTALGTLAVSTLSLSMVLCSHMIRPDVLLLLCALIIVEVARSRRQNFWMWSFGGFVAGISSGFHPHGLLLAAFALMCALFETPRLRRKEIVAGVGLGLAVGFICFYMSIDAETVELGKHTYVMGVYHNLTHYWRARILPWNLLGDASVLVLAPQSFYLAEKFQNSPLWVAAGLATLAGFFWSVTLGIARRERNEKITLYLWGAIIMFFGLGFGALRREMLYVSLLIFFLAPVAAWTLVESVKKIDFSDRLVLSMGLALLSLCWLMKTNLFFFVVIAAVAVSLTPGSDRRVWMVLAGGLIVIICIIVRDPRLVLALHHHFKSDLLQRSAMNLLAWTCLIASSIVAVVIRKQRPDVDNSQMSAVITGGVILWMIIINGASTLYHVANIDRHSVPLESDFGAAQKIVSPGERVLGPAYFWFPFRDRFGDSGALLLDYFYSGRRRPKECFERFRPDVAIIDDDVRRRFFFAPDRSGHLQEQPLSTVLGITCDLVGELPVDAQHSDLQFFRLHWDEKK